MDLQFGQYRLKRAERQLLGAEGPVELSARSFDILALLLGRPDEVIGKSEQPGQSGAQRPHMAFGCRKPDALG